jgi:cbb3-type cytochrome oxidase maturation protein
MAGRRASMVRLSGDAKGIRIRLGAVVEFRRTRTRDRAMGLEVLYLLIPASFVLALAALAFFVWAIRAGQFDDLETPALRMLDDESAVDTGPARGAALRESAPVNPEHP